MHVEASRAIDLRGTLGRDPGGRTPLTTVRGRTHGAIAFHLIGSTFVVDDSQTIGSAECQRHFVAGSVVRRHLVVRCVDTRTLIECRYNIHSV
ncbi:hypothetical protein LSAT2_013168, partial [Lamellibrachia satsuma]